ncbi:pyridoxamine 5'-phosphate oxidase-related FMN-binding [Chthoniobacter flavus Ellin428]|uniref:Pyridoxamine 5'-phosphate oxidase-related FMN-binding n=1 Tax=Chthoniobacter flavus Ellin428 TaxID=497964 RepID=B4D2V5_9BACT|nr:pyridoxamine 5'-phosphate oxidase family protein [Chthoniobacter flavus]EDY19066.1 pyridoxamine 5'-phosphate oxidase-related FMN-binding [Chthoniobacter flavus Ellin428]TCO86829.1 general stress protein 26 [Chthoniobacter flavus]
MNNAPTLENDSFDIEDSDDIIGVAKGLVDGRHFGVLSTINQDGKPEVRWMSTLSFDDFPRFYTLTHPHSRKVEQIKHHPSVNWMFSNHNLSLILNLIGRARVLTDTPTLKRVWQKIEDKSHAYFLKQYAKAPGFVVIETTVEVIECTSPCNALHFTVSPELLAHAHPSPPNA